MNDECFFLTQKENQKRMHPALRRMSLIAFSVQRRSAGPEVGRGVPTPPSLPLDSTHPATGQGLLALDNPKEVGSHRKKTEDSRLFGVKIF